MDLKTTNHTIAWFADQYRSGNLDLEPPYQRNDMVWSSTFKKYFIDTILENYPSPVVFLHVEIFATGVTKYHVVDGKQRLTSIFEYLHGDFTITAEDTPDRYKGIEFSSLGDDLKKSFYQYSIPVQEVHNAGENDLREAFDRLNRNVARLSSQELRHARFTGEFIQTMEGLADEPIWVDLGIATKATLRRMKLDEFVSELFILTMHGIQDGTQSKKLDEFYRDYDDGIPEKDAQFRKYRSQVNIIENLGLNFISSTRYKNLSDFYSLWAAILPFADNPSILNYGATKQALIDFEAQFNNYVENPTHEGTTVNPDIVTYYDNTRQGVNKESNRTERSNVLAKLMVRV